MQHISILCIWQPVAPLNARQFAALTLTIVSLLYLTSLGRTTLAATAASWGIARDLISGSVVTAWAVGGLKAWGAPGCVAGGD